MRKCFYILLAIGLCISCESSDRPVDIVFDQAGVGGILRTQSIENLVYDLDNKERDIQFTLEYQDGQTPSLLESVDFFISFVDNTPANGNDSRARRDFRVLNAQDFTSGINGLPVVNVVISTEELIETLELTNATISCTDTFVLDLQLNQTNGNSFTHDNSIGPIISFGGALNSPFTYDIHVLEPIADDLFTGAYTFETLLEGFEGPTFINPEILEVTTSRLNTRSFEVFRDMQDQVGGVFVRSEVEFTIACDQIILTRYVRSSIVCGSGVEGDVHMLLGPSDDLMGTANPVDDSVFDLKYLEAFEGNDGFCGWPLTPAIVRLSKQ